MRKEVIIGLGVLGVLVSVLGFVLFKTFVGGQSTAEPTAETPRPQLQDHGCGAELEPRQPHRKGGSKRRVPRPPPPGTRLRPRLGTVSGH